MSFNDLSFLGRSESFFEVDYRKYFEEIKLFFKNKKVVVFGGAGSIGSQVSFMLSQFNLERLTIIDKDENTLTSLTRKIRNSDKVVVEEIEFMPFEMGSKICLSWLSQKRFDVVMNFAAMKHVRSEKDPHTTFAMFETNVYKLQIILDHIRKYNQKFHCFSVSSDKAVNSTSYMGLSKKFMEHGLFEFGKDNIEITASSARFANVLFSNGSLPASWEDRMAAGEPISCPKGCKRYFITHEEAAQLCIIATAVAPTGSILVPKMDPDDYLVQLEELAKAFLKSKNFEPYQIDVMQSAIPNTFELIKKQYYPLILTSLDTAGEKPYEEFASELEVVQYGIFSRIGYVDYTPGEFDKEYKLFLKEFEKIYFDLQILQNLTFELLLNLVTPLDPAFSRHHVSSEVNLDERR